MKRIIASLLVLMLIFSVAFAENSPKTITVKNEDGLLTIDYDDIVCRRLPVSTEEGEEPSLFYIKFDNQLYLGIDGIFEADDANIALISLGEQFDFDSAIPLEIIGKFDTVLLGNDMGNDFYCIADAATIAENETVEIEDIRDTEYVEDLGPIFEIVDLLNPTEALTEDEIYSNSAIANNRGALIDCARLLGKFPR